MTPGTIYVAKRRMMSPRARKVLASALLMAALGILLLEYPFAREFGLPPALALAAVGFTVVTTLLGSGLMLISQRRGVRPRRAARSFAAGLTGIASLAAGRRRASDTDTWRDHLHSVEERGAAWRLVPVACGFLVAAVRYRIRDLGAAAAKGLDWLTRTDERFGAVTVLAFLAPCVGCYVAGGWERVWDDMQSTGVVVGFAAGILVWWRRYRGIEVRRSERQRRSG